MTEQLRMKEIVSFIERLGKELGWSSRYMDLYATTAAAVFRSLELDEEADTIPIGEKVLAEQVKRLSTDLSELGRTANTTQTYVTTWKRLTTVASGWVEVRGTPSEQTYWDNLDQFRDTRPKRRHTAAEKELRQRAYRERHPEEDIWKRIDIPLDDGIAVVTLPHKLSQSDAYRIINAVMAAGAVDST